MGADEAEKLYKEKSEKTGYALDPWNHLDLWSKMRQFLPYTVKTGFLNSIFKIGNDASVKKDRLCH